MTTCALKFLQACTEGDINIVNDLLLKHRDGEDFSFPGDNHLVMHHCFDVACQTDQLNVMELILHTTRKKMISSKHFLQAVAEKNRKLLEWLLNHHTGDFLPFDIYEAVRSTCESHWHEGMVIMLAKIPPDHLRYMLPFAEDLEMIRLFFRCCDDATGCNWFQMIKFLNLGLPPTEFSAYGSVQMNVRQMVKTRKQRFSCLRQILAVHLPLDIIDCVIRDYINYE
jgi:hypothetical protein